VHFISGLPKTRSGKMLRRSIQALAEGRDPGDLTTIDDPSTLEQIKAASSSPARQNPCMPRCIRLSATAFCSS
jgi:hypothetical protein